MELRVFAKDGELWHGEQISPKRKIVFRVNNMDWDEKIAKSSCKIMSIPDKDIKIINTGGING